MKRIFFITGIGTGVGKTIVSAVLARYFGADYWKPLQSGDLHQSDSMIVRGFSDDGLSVFPERYRLKLAASPHQSAASEGIDIKISDFEIPLTSNTLLIEGAGGLFVPLNEKEFMIDLIARWKLPVILVIRDYLGCINHSLLSVEALKQRNLELAYVVFNGDFNEASQAIICQHIPENVQVISLPHFMQLEKEQVKQAVEDLKQKLWI